MRVGKARPSILGPLAVTLLAAAVSSACGSRPTSGASIDDVARPPQLVNPDEVVQVIQAEYPQSLQVLRVEGTVRLRIFVGADGVPMEFSVLGTSGNRELDQAAMRVAPHLRFEPAIDREGRPVRVWATFPISFRLP
jgi:protein TonB